MEAVLDIENKEMENLANLFIEKEESFSVYHIYCANHKRAAEIALDEKVKLDQVKPDFDTYQLLSYLIKPVQRICKYPLLIRELIRYTEKGPEEGKEIIPLLQQAWAATDNITKKVNEKQREEENSLIAADVAKRTEDWKSLDTALFGDLLLNDHAVISSKGLEKELLIYLYAHIILIMKESSSAIKRKKGGKAPLILKGNILSQMIVALIPEIDEETNTFNLEIYYQEGQEQEPSLLTIKFRNIELINLWNSMIKKALDADRVSYIIDKANLPPQYLLLSTIGSEGRRAQSAASVSSIVRAKKSTKRTMSMIKPVAGEVPMTQISAGSIKEADRQSQISVDSFKAASSGSVATNAATINSIIKLSQQLDEIMLQISSDYGYSDEDMALRIDALDQRIKLLTSKLKSNTKITIKIHTGTTRIIALSTKISSFYLSNNKDSQQASVLPSFVKMKSLIWEKCKKSLGKMELSRSVGLDEKNFGVKYRDEENEMVSILDDEDFLIALGQSLKNQKTFSQPIFNAFVIPKIVSRTPGQMLHDQEKAT